MAFAYHTSATNTYTSVNGNGINNGSNPYTVTITIPGTVVAGDFLFVISAQTNASLPSGYSATPGWYLMNNGTQTSMNAAVYFKVATNSDASSTFGLYWASGTTRTGAFLIGVYRGAEIDGSYSGSTTTASPGPLNAALDFAGTTNNQTSTATFTLGSATFSKTYMNFRNLVQVAFFSCNSAVTYSSSVTMTHRVSVSNTVSLHLLDRTYDRFPSFSITDQTVTFSGATSGYTPHLFFIESLMAQEATYAASIPTYTLGGLQFSPTANYEMPVLETGAPVAGTAYTRDHTSAFGTWSTHRKIYDVREG